MLNESEDYKLVISKDWSSERGTPLGTTFEKTFRAGPKDRRQPDPHRWTLSSPRARSRDVLSCKFDETLDWALLHSEIKVVTATDNKEIQGTVRSDEAETVWLFEPDGTWTARSCRFAIGSVIEDLAGNSIERPFEVDVTKQLSQTASKRKPIAQTVYRPIKVIPAASSNRPRP